MEPEDYEDLKTEDSWIDYLRTRLPYSFKKIRSERRDHILSEPVRVRHAAFHNFWRRGHVFYLVGKVVDAYDLSQWWVQYRKLLAERARGPAASCIGLADPPEYYYNAMQLEKLWRRTRTPDELDRERVVMTNVCLGLEFCLKAVTAHAGHRRTGVFKFGSSHDLKSLYSDLPDKLKAEVEAESRVFARRYNEFRLRVEADVEHLRDVPAGKRDWEDIGRGIDTDPYTAVIGMNDPCPAPDADWFDEAMDRVGDLSYHRYSPDEGFDSYPTDAIHCGLTLGRFFYEHLFPVREGRDGITKLSVPLGQFVNTHPNGGSGVYFPNR